MRWLCVVGDGAREHGSEDGISAHLHVEGVHHDRDVVLGHCRLRLEELTVRIAIRVDSLACQLRQVVHHS
jgi:hypothetical protein